MSDEKPRSADAARAPSLGEQRAVLAHHLRTGANGGTVLVMELECGHEIWRRIGRRRNIKPRKVQCIGCGTSLNAACGCGCGKVADIDERMTQWTWYRLQWFAPGHGRFDPPTDFPVMKT